MYCKDSLFLMHHYRQRGPLERRCKTLQLHLPRHTTKSSSCLIIYDQCISYRASSLGLTNFLLYQGLLQNHARSTSLVDIIWRAHTRKPSFKISIVAIELNKLALLWLRHNYMVVQHRCSSGFTGTPCSGAWRYVRVHTVVVSRRKHGSPKIIYSYRNLHHS